LVGLVPDDAEQQVEVTTGCLKTRLRKTTQMKPIIRMPRTRLAVTAESSAMKADARAGTPRSNATARRRRCLATAQMHTMKTAASVRRLRRPLPLPTGCSAIWRSRRASST